MNNKKRSIFKSYRMLFSLALENSKIYLAFILINSLCKTANILFTIFIPKIIIDYLMKKPTIKGFTILIAILFVVKLFLNYFVGMVEKRTNHESLIFIKKVSCNFSDKTMRLKYLFLEDKEVLELKQKAISVVKFGMLSIVFNQIELFLTAVFTIISIVAVLINFSILIFIIITVFAVLAFIIEGMMMQKTVAFQQNLIPINRRYEYYSSKLFSNTYQKEHRLYGTAEMISIELEQFNKDIASKLKDINIVMANSRSLNSLFSSITKFILYSYSALRVLGLLGSKISLGSFSALISANENYASAIRNLGFSFAQIIIYLPLVEPLYDFMALKEMVIEKGEQLEDLEEIRFEQISFSYPNTDKLILDNISFTIKKGESVLLVGKNNAGKSTIVKLLCRFFEPTSGRILYNGKDISTINYSSYIEKMSTVFQDYKLFPFTLSENITANATFTDKVYDVIDKVNLKDKVNSLPEGINVFFDKTINENATEFSGGQQQKIAIARSLYKSSPMIILDEPTASLDPISEFEIYSDYSELVQHKTSIFISHRMSASSICDRILVLENGRITGDGIHSELLKTSKLYKSLYDAQAKYYAS